MGQTRRHIPLHPDPPNPGSSSRTFPPPLPPPPLKAFTFSPSSLLAAHQHAALAYLAADRIHTLTSRPPAATTSQPAQHQWLSDTRTNQLAAIATIGHTARCALSIASCPTAATLTLAGALAGASADSIADLVLLSTIANARPDAVVRCAMPEFKRRGMHVAGLGTLGVFLGECFRGCEVEYDAAFVDGFEVDEDRAWWWWKRGRGGEDGVEEEEEEVGSNGDDDGVEEWGNFLDECV
ncbi:uncharacterized protein EHS24_004962 [Apiotrichum porosum]|uniref:Uncharacterized protein n=1 Tax=Apiotrichum porosum TaxID=105984 RepID=A0A427Y6H4_9TREE|nr:uncharacterized protein EHS24_004962 [Apiotrichum porosum]RSH86691.1 hypothetical protein EHS24_004962 [Apiotrichum porosum]